MIEVYKKSDFKSMPWKNGGGLTTELFCLPSIKSDSFLLRLSRAEVSIDGPFSIFPGMDRVLLLLEGKGFTLKSSERQFELNKKLTPFHLRGEEAFSCSLLEGPCVDFNIMTDRNYAHSKVFVTGLEKNVLKSFTATCNLMFIYDTGSETLTKLEKNDHYKVEALNTSPLIVIETTLI